MPRFRSLAAIGAGVVLSIVVAACSGDSNSSGAVSSGDRTINLSESAAKISELNSFRFTLNASIDIGNQAPSTVEDAMGDAFAAMLLSGLKDVKIEGAVVAPDQLQVTANLSGQEFGLVQTGGKAWASFGGFWTPIEPEELGLQNGFDFGDLTADALPVEVAEAAKVSKEKVNGMDTTRYSFDKAALQKLAEDSDSGQDLDSADLDNADLDVWLTSEGIPVKMTMKLSGKDENGQTMSVQLEFTMRDLNSNITIRAPM